MFQEAEKIAIFEYKSRKQTIFNDPEGLSNSARRFQYNIDIPANSKVRLRPLWNAVLRGKVVIEGILGEPHYVIHKITKIVSLSGCALQQRHRDYELSGVEEVRRIHGSEMIARSAIVGVDEGTHIVVWETQDASPNVIFIDPGSVLIFSAEVIHSGGLYDDGHKGRLHYYIETPYMKADEKITQRIVDSVPAWDDIKSHVRSVVSRRRLDGM
jgi:hypothetical protein